MFSLSASELMQQIHEVNVAFDVGDDMIESLDSRFFSRVLSGSRCLNQLFLHPLVLRWT